MVSREEYSNFLKVISKNKRNIIFNDTGEFLDLRNSQNKKYVLNIAINSFDTLVKFIKNDNYTLKQFHNYTIDELSNELFGVDIDNLENQIASSRGTGNIVKRDGYLLMGLYKNEIFRELYFSKINRCQLMRKKTLTLV